MLLYRMLSSRSIRLQGRHIKVINEISLFILKIIHYDA